MTASTVPARRARPVAALLVATLVAGACSSGGDSGPPPTVEVRPATTLSPPTTTASSGTSVPSVATLDDVAVGYEAVATFDDTPMAMAVRPGDVDLVYVALRSGTLVRLDPSTAPDTVAEPVLDFSGDVSTDGERGFLGLAFAPDGEHLYVSYTNRGGDTRIDEYAVSGEGDGATIDGDARREVLGIGQPFGNHNGGNIAFGPDGYLYLGLGDGGSGGDPDDRAQDPTDLLGKFLRIDPRVGGTPYGVPDDNPNVGGADGAEARTEIWLRGVRNPWRWSFDPVTGDLWIADVGQEEVEEVNFLPNDGTGHNAGRAANLGWNEMEGDQPYEGGQPPSGYVGPVLTYRHEDGGCSVTGGYVYRGTQVPALEGAYLYTDYCSSRLQAALVDGSRTVAAQADLGALPESGPVSFGQDADNELYVLFQGGQLVRLTAG